MSARFSVQWEAIEHGRDDDGYDDRLNEAQMYRANVPGGWLVLFLADQRVGGMIGDGSQAWNSAPGMTFVPDPKHSWRS